MTTNANTRQRLAIFDLDNTLLGGDSDHAWGEFLIEKGLVDADEHRRINDGFYQDYQRGELDIQAYLRFALAFARGHSEAELAPLHNEFMQTVIAPMHLPASTALLQKHRDAGDYLLIITATNRFITGPIAKELGVDELLASDAEIRDGRYTGEPSGTPCFQQGKVQRLSEWLASREFSLDDSYFYSDSHNDLPLLKAVGHPVAVDPDDALREHAEREQWPVISLR